MAVNQQQLDYLCAMGIPVWVSRDLAMPDPAAAKELGFSLDTVDNSLSAELTDEAIAEVHESSPIIATPDVAADETVKKGLRAADELIKDLQQTPAKQIAELAASLDESVETKSKVISESLDGVDWIDLEKAVSQCTSCDLHEKRHNTVFGYGSKQQVSLMIVGDIPRLSDEQEQQPFTGEAGKLLSNMLSHLGLNADTIYFTNLLKCRPPLDNAPQVNQAASCLSYLKQQIKLLQPPLVLLLGRVTVNRVLSKELPMAQLRQKIHQLEGFDTHFIASYHPAYLLKQPRLKPLAWKDLQFTKQVLTNNG